MPNNYVVKLLIDIRDQMKWIHDKQPLDPESMEHLGKAHAHICQAIEIEQNGD